MQNCLIFPIVEETEYYDKFRKDVEVLAEECMANALKSLANLARNIDR